MDIEDTQRLATNVEARRLLDVFYKVDTPTAPIEGFEFPPKRRKSKWEDDNKRGFFLGIIQVGLAEHVTRLCDLLNTKGFKDQQEFSTKVQLANSDHPRTFIDEMFNFYIQSFHKDYNGSVSSQTPSSSAHSSHLSRNGSAEDLDVGSLDRELSLPSFRSALKKRDGVCLFCWDNEDLEAAHIIARKDVLIAVDETSILVRAGLAYKNLVQNGLWLCKKCHSRFDNLKRYVDVLAEDEDVKLVVKVVNATNDPTNDKHRVWLDAIKKIESDRSILQHRWESIDNRRVKEGDGEMTLYFMPGKATELQPNREALKFHKAACTIWKMAGGAEEGCPDDEDDDYIPVGYGSNKVQKWVDSLQ
jgi:hypothetical protein